MHPCCNWRPWCGTKCILYPVVNKQSNFTTYAYRFVDWTYNGRTRYCHSSQQSAPLWAHATAHRAPDAGDQFLWDLLALRDDLVLITDDKLLLQDHPMQARVISPQDFAGQRWR